MFSEQEDGAVAQRGAQGEARADHEAHLDGKLLPVVQQRQQQRVAPARARRAQVGGGLRLGGVGGAVDRLRSLWRSIKED